MKSLTLTTAPATEPVTLAEAQAFLNVDSDDDSTLVEALIKAARVRFEQFTGRALISQTWKYIANDWPPQCSAEASYLFLDRSPLVSVQSVKYYPASGAAQATLSSAAYHVMTGPMPGLIVLASTETWPDLYDRPDAVEVNFTAGAASAAAVDELVKVALKWDIKHFYDQRNDAIIGNIVNQLPRGYGSLCDMYRVGGWIA